MKKRIKMYASGAGTNEVGNSLGGTAIARQVSRQTRIKLCCIYQIAIDKKLVTNYHNKYYLTFKHKTTRNTIRSPNVTSQFWI